MAFNWHPRGARGLLSAGRLRPETPIEALALRLGSRDALKAPNIYCIEWSDERRGPAETNQVAEQVNETAMNTDSPTPSELGPPPPPPSSPPQESSPTPADRQGFEPFGYTERN